MATTITPASGLPPTTQAYHELQLAYDFFNGALFDGKLPPCFITLQRKGSSTRGYFSPGRFATTNGSRADEIALNPRHFKNRTHLEVLSTMVHEMVHQWQHHFGSPSRGGYHNKEWAERMMWLGLRPSRTGQREGPLTGQRMTHCIIAGGRFEIAANKLRAMLPALTWFDADPAVEMPKGLIDSGLFPSPPLSGRRTVYRCPACDDHATGKSTLNLVCGKCDRQMLPDGHR